MNNVAQVAIKTNTKVRIAAFIAGDENIVHPGMLSLASVKLHHNMDLFLFTEKSKLSSETINEIEREGIAIIDVSECLLDGDLGDLKQFGRWPVHVFYNYIAPITLRRLGYDYAVKLDYDLICIKEYDWDAIVPSYQQIISIVHKRPLSAFIEEAKLQQIGLAVQLENFNSVTAGFFIINLRAYVERKVFTVYKQIYSLLSKVNLDQILIGETVEQITFGLIQCILETKFKALEQAYNFRPYYFSKVPDIRNVHLNTKFKPWHNISFNKPEGEVFGWFRSILYFQLWRNYSQKICLRDGSESAGLRKIESDDLCEAFETLRDRILGEKFLYLCTVNIFKSNMLPSNTDYLITGTYVRFFISDDRELYYEIMLKKDRVRVALYLKNKKFSVKYFRKLNSVVNVDKRSSSLYIDVNKLGKEWNSGKVIQELNFLIRATRSRLRFLYFKNFMKNLISPQGW